MLRRITFIFLCCLVWQRQCEAQEEILSVKGDTINSVLSSSSTNILQIELGGNAHFLSLNYEHIYNNHFGYRLGLGLTLTNRDIELYHQSYTNSDLVGVGILMGEYHWSLSKGYFFKTGLGIVSLLSFNYRTRWEIARDSSNVQPFALTGSLGFEYIQPDGGIMVAITTNPICSIMPSYVRLFFGFSIGVAF